MDPRFLSKLTTSNTGMMAYAKKNVPEDDQKAFPVGYFAGTISGIKPYVDDKGEVTYALSGEFKAVNYRKVDKDGKPDDNGEQQEYRSGILWLPGGAHDSAVAPFLAVQQHNANLKDGEKRQNYPSIILAYEVAVIKANNPAGYSWAGKALIDSKEADPFAEIDAAIAAKKQAALPKPATKAA